MLAVLKRNFLRAKRCGFMSLRIIIGRQTLWQDRHATRWRKALPLDCLDTVSKSPWQMVEKGIQQIVVLGAGFGGLTFCKHFRHPTARITLVDRTNHHLFQPLLYQVATAGLAAPDIAQPIRSILSDRPNVTVLLDEVLDIKLSDRTVILEETTLKYDYLVLALGGVTSYFGHPEWEP